MSETEYNSGDDFPHDVYAAADEARLREFCWWMCERQAIYRRREIENQDPPWTENDVLQQYHFCNVYRELDRGSRYLRYNIVNRADDRDVLANVVFYRLLNLPSSYEAAGGFFEVDTFDADAVVDRLEAHDGRLFSSAYRIGHTMGSAYDTMHEAIVYETLDDHLLPQIDDYYDAVRDDPEDALRRLQDIPQVGEFVAYEVLTDLTYGFLDATENDFLSLGPGAKKGLKQIWGDADERYIYWLVDNQKWLFDACDLDFYAWNGTREKDLTLRAIEHSLCEYQKFRRALTSDNPSLRKYDPQG